MKFTFIRFIAPAEREEIGGVTVGRAGHRGTPCPLASRPLDRLSVWDLAEVTAPWWRSMRKEEEDKEEDKEEEEEEEENEEEQQQERGGAGRRVRAPTV